MIIVYNHIWLNTMILYNHLWLNTMNIVQPYMVVHHEHCSSTCGWTLQTIVQLCVVEHYANCSRIHGRTKSYCTSIHGWTLCVAEQIESPQADYERTLKIQKITSKKKCLHQINKYTNHILWLLWKFFFILVNFFFIVCHWDWYW